MERIRIVSRESRSVLPNAWSVIKFKPTTGDFFILFFLLSLTLLQILFFSCKTTFSREAAVYYDGRLIKTIDLESPRFEGVVGNGKRLMVVQVGSAGLRVASSTCGDKLCQKQGYILRSGDTVVCLPNKVVIETLGSREADAVIR